MTERLFALPSAAELRSTAVRLSTSPRPWQVGSRRPFGAAPVSIGKAYVPADGQDRTAAPRPFDAASLTVAVHFFPNWLRERVHS